MQYELKTKPFFFEKLWSRQKRFEVRKMQLEEGDSLVLRELVAAPSRGTYSGRIVRAVAGYVTECPDLQLLQDGVVVAQLVEMQNSIRLSLSFEKTFQSKTHAMFWLLWKRGHIVGQTFEAEAVAVAERISLAIPTTRDEMISCGPAGLTDGSVSARDFAEFADQMLDAYTGKVRVEYETPRDGLKIL